MLRVRGGLGMKWLEYEVVWYEVVRVRGGLGMKWLEYGVVWV